MIITRRGLLAGILAAAAGPAIVRASSLMQIAVPPSQRIWTPGFDYGNGDFTMEGFFQEVNNGSYIDEIRVTNGVARYAQTFVHPTMDSPAWKHFAVTNTGFYKDGVLQPVGPSTEFERKSIDNLASITDQFLSRRFKR